MCQVMDPVRQTDPRWRWQSVRRAEGSKQHFQRPRPRMVACRKGKVGLENLACVSGFLLPKSQISSGPFPTHLPASPQYKNKYPAKLPVGHFHTHRLSLIARKLSLTLASPAQFSYALRCLASRANTMVFRMRSLLTLLSIFFPG